MNRACATTSMDARFDLDALDAIEATRVNTNGSPQQVPRPCWNNGSPGKRLDLLITGDGYTSAQRTKFENAALAYAARFFSTLAVQGIPE